MPVENNSRGFMIYLSIYHTAWAFVVVFTDALGRSPARFQVVYEELNHSEVGQITGGN